MGHLMRRILFYLAAIWASITLNFFIPRLAPGNPAEILVNKLENQGGHPDIAYINAIKAAFGVTSAPLWMQYLTYLNNLLHGNLGISSLSYPDPVNVVIGRNLMWTLGLGLVAVVLSFGLGCLTGIVLAWKRGSWLDSFMVPFMNFVAAIPYFWMALFILYIFGFTLRWFPLSGGYDILNFDLVPGWNLDYILNVIQHAILPAATIVIASLAGWMLTMRNSMITTLSEDYVLLARAKGLHQRRIMFSYAARNAILPNLTGFAMSIGFILSGQLLTEMVFSYPGVGYLLLQSVQQRDYGVMQGIFLLIALAVLGANFLADLMYAVFDPRVRVERNG